MPMLCVVAVFVIEYIGFRKRTKEYRELEHFAEFLSDLKDQFYLCKNITESIFRAAERMPGGLRKRLEKMCFLLEEDAMGTVIPEDEFPGHLKYIRLFWIQCRSAVQYGSGKNSTESVFVKNMTELRRDVQNECYQREQAMYLFGGMGVVAVAPVMFLPAIRWFGTVTMEELQTFYEGRTGSVIVLVFGLLTVCCYILLCMVRQSDKRVFYRPKLLRQLFGGDRFRWGAEFFKGSLPERKGAKYLAEIGIEANGMQYWVVCGMVGAAVSLCTVYLLRGTSLPGQMAGLFCGAAVGVVLVRGFYKYLGYLRKLGTEGEVLSLQSIVLLLIDVPNITLMELLDVLGACGELFRKRLLRCADEYAAEDAVALERLFTDAEEPAFRRFAGRILAGERIGLKVAFAEIAADRNFFREQLRLEAEQERKKKAANAQVIAFLPMLFLLFAYLILPFLGVSLEQMGAIFKEMERIRYF